MKMSALLRIANALDCTHETKVKDIICTIKKTQCVCVLLSDVPCVDEMARVTKETKFFNQVYGLDFIIRERMHENQIDQFCDERSTISAVL